MALNAEQKGEIVKNHQRGDADTGSPEVQVALLTANITALTDHFSEHKADHHSRRGLLKLVSQRRKLLDHMNAEDSKRYQTIIAQLGIRR